MSRLIELLKSKLPNLDFPDETFFGSAFCAEAFTEAELHYLDSLESRAVASYLPRDLQDYGEVWEVWEVASKAEGTINQHVKLRGYYRSLNGIELSDALQVYSRTKKVTD